MIFWSKKPENKKEEIKARQARDKSLFYGKMDQDQANALAEENGMNAASEEGGVSANEGLDEDLGSKIGRKGQQAKQGAQAIMVQASRIHARLQSKSKQISRSRGRSKKKAKGMGF